MPYISKMFVLILERREGCERQRGIEMRIIDWLLNLGICPDWELNQ